MGFNVTCSPGHNAEAGMVQVAPGIHALILYLDPVNVAVQVPPFPEGPKVLARFCRQLAREATRFADLLDPAWPSENTGRHTLMTQDEPGPGVG
ncbi:hypothetical protein [Gandjariella thermophila]|uniref:Uncharacterized protein n=1 Tax=Gandjariella thermophila TaxID=1931992 RepID=A0A4D4JDB0_9PSEU|nr:hypothetical protein [Gandjariella thermophila]GDY33000.1 hypothetical protein GTS_46330 [Gandjariella thermophila]